MIFKKLNFQRLPHVLVTLFVLISVLVLVNSSLMGLEPERENKEVLQSETALGEERRIPFPKPDSHKANWLEFHGASADLTVNEAGIQGKACYVCHEKTDCVECHNTRPPRDHTNFWRTRSHGLMAEGNRDRCLNCHRQDYCVRCHNETAPRSHTGNWVSRHCRWCHFGFGLTPANNCSVCHRVAPHTSAPHPVSANLDCTVCH